MTVYLIHLKTMVTFVVYFEIYQPSSKLYMPFAGSRTARRSLEFGRTHVVRPKGKHQATIVWLHGLGDNGLRYGCHIFNICYCYIPHSSTRHVLYFFLVWILPKLVHSSSSILSPHYYYFLHLNLLFVFPF